ncbi:PAS domain S-box protein [Desulfarculus baarsii]
MQESLKVLLIEDEADFAGVVRKLLENNRHFAFKVDWAQSLAHGLTMMDGGRYQVVLLDLNLPDSRGLETLRILLRAAPEMPVVVLTGIDDADVAMRSLELGAQDFLDKGEISGKLLPRSLRFAVAHKNSWLLAQSAKQEKETILDSLVEHVVFTDNQSRVLWANRAACEAVGKTREEVEGRLCYEIWADRGDVCPDCPLGLAMATGQPQAIERTSRSGKFWQIKGAPVRDPGGAIVGGVEMALDVTARKKAEEALAASEKRYRHLVENAADIIYRTDIDNIVTFVNKAAEDITGYGADELVGMKTDDLVAPEHRKQVYEHYRRQFELGQYKVYLEFPIVAKDGRTVWLGQNLWSVEENGKLAGFEAIARDITELRDAREALQAAYEGMEDRIAERTAQLEMAKRQWEDTFNAVPDAIAIIDRGHKVLRANKAMARLAGLQPHDIVGKECLAVLHGCDKGFETCPHTRLIKDGQQHSQEFFDPVLGVDMLVTTSPLWRPDGKLMGSVHVARDISQLKNAEKAVQEQLRFLQMLVDTIPHPIFFKDKDGLFTGCNRAFELLMGLSRQDVLGRTARQALPEGVLDLGESNERQAMAKGSTISYETRLANAAGEKRDVIFNVVAYKDAEGQPAGLVGSILDITEQRAAARELRQSEERYRTLIETLSEGLVVVDENLNIKLFNPRFIELVGYPADVVNRAKFTDFLDDENKAVVTAQYEKRKKGGRDSYELAFTRQDGGKVYTLISPKPIFDASGVFKGSYALVTDLTERKILESQLMQAQKLEAIGQLAAGIAHEINTPAQFVSSNTRFLEESFADLTRLCQAYSALGQAALAADGELAALARAAQELAQEIDHDYLIEEIPKAIGSSLEGLGRVAKIVQSMKEFAHPGRDDFSPVDINKAIENTVTVARNEWKYVSDLETDLDPDLPHVPGLVAELNQVFLNIIVNAAQALAGVIREGVDEKGLIRISTRATATGVEVRICDSGPGIPEHVGRKIFDPFFTTKEPGKGTGQGLSIAYRVVAERHKGALNYENRPEGGACFVINLPLVREED